MSRPEAQVSLIYCFPVDGAAVDMALTAAAEQEGNYDSLFEEVLNLGIIPALYVYDAANVYFGWVVATIGVDTEAKDLDENFTAILPGDGKARADWRVELDKCRARHPDPASQAFFDWLVGQADQATEQGTWRWRLVSEQDED